MSLRVHGLVWAAWQTNLAQAETDFSAAADERIVRMVAAYMTLGDYKTVDSLIDLVSAAMPEVTIDKAAYDRSRQRYFYHKDDPDNDGRTNRDQWQRLGDLPWAGRLAQFITDSLNAVREEDDGGDAKSGGGGASGSGGPPGCDTPDCLDTRAVTMASYPGGAATAAPSGDAVALGTQIAATAEPGQGYAFTQWLAPGALIHGSKRRNEETPLLPGGGPLDMTALFTSYELKVNDGLQSSYIENVPTPSGKVFEMEPDHRG